MVDESPKRRSQIKSPIIGLGICVLTFVVGVFLAFETMIGFGGRHPADSVTAVVDFLLAAPIVGGAICLVWFVAALVRSYNE